MEITIPPKSDDPQRLLALNGVDKKFWLSAGEINQLADAVKFLLGKRSSLYLEEHDSLYELELKHPNPAPGSYAQIVVADGPNQKAEWDNTLKKWVITGDYDYPENQSGAGDARVIYFNSGYQSGLTYKVSAAWNFPGLSFGTEANPVTKEITLDPADALHPRIDLIVLNSDGTITKKTGIAGANPTKPAIDPNKQLEATFILIPAGSEVPDGISTILIYNENTQAAGGEFNTAEDTGGTRINLASVANFTTGAKAIEATKTKYYDTVSFTPENPITIEGNITEIGFDFKNKPSEALRNIFFRFRGEDENGNEKIKSLAPSAYDPDSEDWQFVSMSLAKLNFPILTSFELVANGMKQDDFGFFMDNVRFVGGTQPVNNDYVRFEDLQSYALNDLSNLISNLSEAQKTEIKNKLGIVEGGAGGSYTPPSPYGTMQAMYDDQANQVANQTYRVTDASGHSEVNAGRAWFEYKGTLNAAEGDYILKSEEESLNLDQQFDALQQQITNHEGRIQTLENQLASSNAWQNRYQTIADLLNGQANQNADKKQWVYDASTDETVESGWAVYELKDNAVKTAALSDYRKLSEQESMDVASGGGLDPTQQNIFTAIQKIKSELLVGVVDDSFGDTNNLHIRQVDTGGTNPRVYEIVSFGNSTNPGWRSKLTVGAYTGTGLTGFIFDNGKITTANNVDISGLLKALGGIEITGNISAGNITTSTGLIEFNNNVKLVAQRSGALMGWNYYASVQSVGSGWSAIHRFYFVAYGYNKIGLDMSMDGSGVVRINVNGVFKPEELDLSELTEASDDTVASSKGVPVGYAYVNSSTGAVHKRRS